MKKTTPKHVIIKSLKTSDKERNVKAARGKRYTLHTRVEGEADGSSLTRENTRQETGKNTFKELRQPWLVWLSGLSTGL